MDFTIAKNNTFNSLEINFDGKPSEMVRNLLKKFGFRWHGVRRIWYGYGNEAEILNALKGVADNLTEATEKTAAPAQVLPSLWERCDTSSIKQHDKNNLPPVKEIAATLRKELKKRFPECKFSITSTYNNIDAYIVAAPYNRIEVDDMRFGGKKWQNSDELEAVVNYCRALAGSWNYDDSDPYTDYFDCHFYGAYFQLGYGFEYTTPTAEQAADIADFKAKKAEKEARDRAAAVAEYNERKAKAEEEARTTAENTAKIEENAKLEEIPEAEQFAAVGLKEYAKINSLKEVETYGEPSRDDAAAIVEYKLTFDDEKIYNTFSDMLLHDFTFLAHKGGTGSEDCRVKDWRDYERLTAEQRETVKTFSVKAVGVYLKEDLKFIVDPQGFTYARYILLPGEEFATVNAREYCEGLRKESESLAPFYIPAPVFEQVKTADLKAGEPITVISLDEWIIMARETRGTLESITAKSYAQYSDGGEVVITPQGKRSPQSFHFHNGSKFAIFRGFLPNIGDKFKYKDCGGNLQEVNFCGMGAENYIKRLIAEYKRLGFNPVIDLIAK